MIDAKGGMRPILTVTRMDANNAAVKRLCALWLLFCVGFSFPAAGGFAHLCLAESLWENIWTSDCCDDCHGHDVAPASCCFELDDLPDGQSPEPPPVVPAVAVIDLDGLHMAPPMRSMVMAKGNAGSHPVRGPTSAERRACLAVWRL